MGGEIVFFSRKNCQENLEKFPFRHILHLHNVHTHSQTKPIQTLLISFL